jgi:signal peptide peptidase SppA
MNLIRVIEALYCDPWCLIPKVHAMLCQIVQQHVDGSAHAPGGCAAEFTDAKGPLKEADVRTMDLPGRAKPGESMKIAVVPVNGVIGRKFSSELNNSGVVSIDVLERIVESLANDASVAAIVLDIESPGGHSSGVGDAADTIARATASKPIVAYSGGVMASAAYWLAAPADAIVVGRTANVGSIGVYTVIADSSDYYKRMGIDVELIKAGRLKGIGVDGIGITDEGRAYLQARVDKVYQQFTGAVRANRTGVADETMQGQAFDGDDAVALNLADRIGSLNDAVEMAAEMARERRETKR